VFYAGLRCGELPALRVGRTGLDARTLSVARGVGDEQDTRDDVEAHGAT